MSGFSNTDSQSIRAKIMARRRGQSASPQRVSMEASTTPQVVPVEAKTTPQVVSGSAQATDSAVNNVACITKGDDQACFITPKPRNTSTRKQSVISGSSLDPEASTVSERSFDPDPKYASDRSFDPDPKYASDRSFDPESQSKPNLDAPGNNSKRHKYASGCVLNIDDVKHDRLLMPNTKDPNYAQKWVESHHNIKKRTSHSNETHNTLKNVAVNTDASWKNGIIDNETHNTLKDVAVNTTASLRNGIIYNERHNTLKDVAVNTDDSWESDTITDIAVARAAGFDIRESSKYMPCLMAQGAPGAGFGIRESSKYMPGLMAEGAPDAGFDIRESSKYMPCLMAQGAPDAGFDIRESSKYMPRLMAQGAPGAGFDIRESSKYMPRLMAQGAVSVLAKGEYDDITNLGIYQCRRYLKKPRDANADTDIRESSKDMPGLMVQGAAGAGFDKPPANPEVPRVLPIRQVSSTNGVTVIDLSDFDTADYETIREVFPARKQMEYALLRYEGKSREEACEQVFGVKWNRKSLVAGIIESFMS